MLPNAGRSTPRMRPRPNSAAAMTAPELPADAKACARPSLTSRMPTMSEESFLALTAIVCSSIATTSDAWTTSMGRLAVSPCLASSALTCSWTPTRMISVPRSRASATAPATTTPGAWSPPMASTTIFML